VIFLIAYFWLHLHWWDRRSLPANEHAPEGAAATTLAKELAHGKRALKPVHAGELVNAGRDALEGGLAGDVE